MLGGIKTPIVEYFQTEGEAPTLSKLGNVTKSGKYVSSITASVATGSAAVSTYTATFKSTGVNSNLSGKTVLLKFDHGDQSFSCEKGTVDEAFLPAGCK